MLLQTAVVEVYNPTVPSLMQRVRIILNNGSQRSYLTREKLALTTTSTQQLSITAFGSKTKPCEAVRVQIRTRSKPDLELDLFVVPHICDALAAHPSSSYLRWYPHLTHLEHADDVEGDTPLEVDVLIGSDTYWNLVSEGNGEPYSGQNETWMGALRSSRASRHSNCELVSTHTLRIDSATEQVDVTLRSFWELEALGINE